MDNLRSALATALTGVAIAIAAGLNPAAAQAVGEQASQAGLARVTTGLVNSAQHWRSRGEYGFALHELDRVLGFAPGNADVLALAADISLEISDYKLAERYRLMLGKVAPDDPRLPMLAAEHEWSPPERATLLEARRLGQTGQPVEAVKAYRTLLGIGAVPRSLAVEFYATLAATPDGIDEASEKLGSLADQFANDANLQLAYARLLTLDEGSRPRGIRRLSSLAAMPGVDVAARQAWREALLWQGPSEKSRTQLQDYLHANAADPALEAKLAEYNAILPDDSAKAMIRGYNIMASDLASAEREFKAALAYNPRNPDAMVMLAAIGRKQRRAAEAQAFVEAAVAISPDRREELVHSAGGDFPLSGGTLQDNYEIALLTATQQYEKAEQILSRIAAVPGNTSRLVQLGTIQQRMGHLQDAEASLRKARAENPASGDAASELAAIMAANGKPDEAASLYMEAAALYARANNKGGVRLAKRSLAALGRDHAADNPDTGGSAAPHRRAAESNGRHHVGTAVQHVALAFVERHNDLFVP